MTEPPRWDNPLKAVGWLLALLASLFGGGMATFIVAALRAHALASFYVGIALIALASAGLVLLAYRYQRAWNETHVELEKLQAQVAASASAEQVQQLLAKLEHIAAAMDRRRRWPW